MLYLSDYLETPPIDIYLGISCYILLLLVYLCLHLLNLKQARKLQDAQAEKLTSLQAHKLTN